MRSFLRLLIGIVLGGGGLFYGYLHLQSLQDKEYVVSSQSAIVTQLQSLARLTTAQMTVSKVLEGKKDFTDFFPGTSLDDSIREALFDDALVMEVEGKVNAGVDLSHLAVEDITVDPARNRDNTRIVVSLPHATIVDVYLTENTKPFERKLGILTRGNPDLETKMRNDALTALRQEALTKDIITVAEDNAIESLQDVLDKLGFVNIEIKFQ